MGEGASAKTPRTPAASPLSAVKPKWERKTPSKVMQMFERTYAAMSTKPTKKK
jgi:uncharacterized Fe-S center protein